MNGADVWKGTTAAARGVLWRSQMGYGTRIDGDRYLVTLPKNMTVEDVLIDRQHPPAATHSVMQSGASPDAPLAYRELAAQHEWN
ncbi:hypothetical protein ACFFJ7_19060 [Pseudochelatococcus lubricantis]|uniref:hypothetical protein n=1 Tax=Pseudochelatococcus lubricantis TaxID=1538102 RepID=UPI0035EC20F0